MESCLSKCLSYTYPEIPSLLISNTFFSQGSRSCPGLTQFSTQSRVVSDEFVYMKLAERETCWEYDCMSLYPLTQCCGFESEYLLMHVRQFNVFLSIFLYHWLSWCAVICFCVILTLTFGGIYPSDIMHFLKFASRVQWISNHQPVFWISVFLQDPLSTRGDRSKTTREFQLPLKCHEKVCLLNMDLHYLTL